MRWSRRRTRVITKGSTPNGCSFPSERRLLHPSIFDDILMEAPVSFYPSGGFMRVRFSFVRTNTGFPPLAPRWYIPIFILWSLGIGFPLIAFQWLQPSIRVQRCPTSTVCDCQARLDGALVPGTFCLDVTSPHQDRPPSTVDIGDPPRTMVTETLETMGPALSSKP